jgi:hypothetical protein
MVYRIETENRQFSLIAFETEEDAESYLKRILAQASDRKVRAAARGAYQNVKAHRTATRALGEFCIVEVEPSELEPNTQVLVDSKKQKRLSSIHRNYIEIG